MYTPDYQFFLEVIVNGRPLKEYPYRDEWFVEGAIGQEFTLRVGKLDSQRRALAVLSVDGLSVMSGKPASSDDGGYIIERYKSFIDIPGWRLNNAAVAAFFFATLPETYATQMGKPTNIGVIGAKFWYEDMPLPPPVLGSVSYGQRPPDPGGSAPPMPPLPPPSVGAPPAPGSAPPAPASVPPQAPGVGTGFGRKREHSVTYESFRRDQSTVQTAVLRYDTAENLQARGIILLRNDGDRVMNANPFPADGPGATPPPGWRG